jgi:nicotinate-nucleotide adenylyltransferase
MHVAVFGGSFDPPHAGHVLMAAYLGIVAGFSRVLVVPAYAHAFDKPLTAFEHRVSMCELAFEKLAFVEVSQIESTLQRPSYMLHTLQAICRLHPDWELRLAMGSDVVAETHNWYAFDQVAALAPPLVISRQGFANLAGCALVLPEVSSTQLRDCLREPDRPASARILQEMLPAGTRSYIEQCSLYL